MRITDITPAAVEALAKEIGETLTRGEFPDGQLYLEFTNAGTIHTWHFTNSRCVAYGSIPAAVREKARGNLSAAIAAGKQKDDPCENTEG